MSTEVQKNKFVNGHVIGNFLIGQLTAQKKRKTEGGADDQTIDQVPFSIGVGISRRARGIPYVVSLTDKPEQYFPASKPHDVVD
jgi:hypothetical protein